MIDVGKFAKPIVFEKAGGRETFFRFATNTSEEIAAELHRFADRIASGDILIQKVQGGQVASVDEYFMQALFIEFVEGETPEKTVVLPVEEWEGGVAYVDLPVEDLPPNTSITLNVPPSWTPAQIDTFRRNFIKNMKNQRMKVQVYQDKGHGFE